MLTFDLCCPVQEFENADGEETQVDMSRLLSPASQGVPEVYVLPLTEVSLPVAQQPRRSGRLAVQSTPNRVLEHHSTRQLKGFSEKQHFKMC